MKNIKGNNAILTGASRGIGAKIASALAREGVNLALAARSAVDLERVRDEVDSYGIKAVSIPTDLAEIGQIYSLAQKAEEQLGPVDLIINNAGTEGNTAFEDYTVGDIEAMVSINLLAPMLLTRILLPGMIERGRGHIVNISSLAGKTGLPYQTPYSATKSGLVMFTHSLRAELMNRPVGASVICPGFVSGDGMYARIEDAGERAPMILKPTTTNRVVKAVIKSIKKDIAELIVNPLPMRPGIVMREIFPRITPSMHKLLGTTAFGRRLSAKKPTG